MVDKQSSHYWYHWWNYQVETAVECMDYRRITAWEVLVMPLYDTDLISRFDLMNLSVPRF